MTGVRSLIKLHGGGYSLRADYSLDTLPPEQDRWRFLEYLLSAKGRRDLESRDRAEGGLDFHSHLIVMGVSAADRRTKGAHRHGVDAPTQKLPCILGVSFPKRRRPDNGVR
jgi:hypothetical protein